ncbi:MAG: FkbM family methyltransferase [Nitrospirae bacterium]|nr:FkbM family methyltransferase [Nitrospirota bacterium]
MMPSGQQFRHTMLTAVAPLIRLFPPWWKARFYRRMVGSHFGETGCSGIVKRRRVSPHRYEMELQLDDPMERFAYFLGCYWGIDVTATVVRLLRQGDYFIDVGANLGFVTLAASRAVGREGKVLAFEPFTAMADRLDRALLHNRIENVTVYRYALGDAMVEGVLDLDEHSSKANLRHADSSGAKIQIMRGDDVRRDWPSDTWILVKMDVEGYELRALKGWPSLLTRPRTGFLVEITDQWLRDLGGSAEELFNLMLGQGFQAYIPKLTFLSQLELSPLSCALAGRQHYDALFLRPEEGWLSR